MYRKRKVMSVLHFETTDSRNNDIKFSNLWHFLFFCAFILIYFMIRCVNNG
jgi:hypothetical protein